MSLINLLISEPSEIDMRVTTRTEFQLLGIDAIIAYLKKIDNQDLNTQLEVYEDLAQDDADEIKETIAKSGKDVSNVRYPNKEKN